SDWCNGGASTARFGGHPDRFVGARTCRDPRALGLALHARLDEADLTDPAAPLFTVDRIGPAMEPGWPRTASEAKERQSRTRAGTSVNRVPVVVVASVAVLGMVSACGSGGSAGRAS